MPEDVFELRRLEFMVHGYYYRTQSPRPKERVHEFRSIKAHEGHGIAGTYTSFRQDGRREVGPGLHFPVGNGDVSRATSPTGTKPRLRQLASAPGSVCSGFD